MGRVVVVVTILIVVFLLVVKLGSKHGAPSKDVGLTPVRTLKKGFVGAFEWKLDAHQSYEYQAKASLHIEDSRWKVQSNAIETDLRARYHLRVLAIDPGVVWLGAQMTNVGYMQGDRSARVLGSLLEQTPCILKLTPEGRLLDIIVPDAVRDKDRNLLVGVNQLQFELPMQSQQPAEAWVEQESSSAGTVEANYAWQDSGVIKKLKSDFIKPGDNPQVQLHLTEASAEGVLGRFWLEQYSSLEKQTAAFQGAPFSTSSATVSLKATAGADMPAELKAFSLGDSIQVMIKQVQDYRPASLGREGSAWLRQEQGEKDDAMANVPFAEVLNDLLRTADQATRHAEQLPAIERMRDWLQAHPDQAFRVAEKLKDNSLSDIATGLLVHTLELAGSHQEAQDALATILNGKEYSDQVLAQTIVASSGVGELKSDSLKAILRTTAFDPPSVSNLALNDAAVLALGVLAKDNPGLANDLGQHLYSNLTPAENLDPTDTVIALHALANGHISNPDSIAQACELLKVAPSDRVRAAAVDYLGRVASSAGEIKEALHDPAASVVVNAVHALTADRAPSSDNVDLLLSLAETTTTNARVKAEIVQSLEAWPQEVPDRAKRVERLRASLASDS